MLMNLMGLISKKRSREKTYRRRGVEMMSRFNGGCWWCWKFNNFFRGQIGSHKKHNCWSPRALRVKFLIPLLCAVISVERFQYVSFFEITPSFRFAYKIFSLENNEVFCAQKSFFGNNKIQGRARVWLNVELQQSRREFVEH